MSEPRRSRKTFVFQARSPQPHVSLQVKSARFQQLNSCIKTPTNVESRARWDGGAPNSGSARQSGPAEPFSRARPRDPRPVTQLLSADIPGRGQHGHFFASRIADSNGRGAKMCPCGDSHKRPSVRPSSSRCATRTLSAESSRAWNIVRGNVFVPPGGAVNSGLAPHACRFRHACRLCRQP